MKRGTSFLCQKKKYPFRRGLQRKPGIMAQSQKGVGKSWILGSRFTLSQLSYILFEVLLSALFGKKYQNGKLPLQWNTPRTSRVQW